MSEKPTYEELEQRFKEIEKTVVELKSEKKKLKIMKDAVASSINAIGITDLKGKMIYVNDACIKMWGYDHENEILGRSLSEFWEGDGIFNTIKELQEKGVASGDDIGKRKDGSLFNVQFSANTFKDEVGNPAYMFGSFFDITDRKRAEKVLQQAQIIDQIHDSVISTDMEGNITFSNKGSEKLHGYTVRELSGKHISFIFSDDEQETLQKQVIEPLVEKGTHDTELRMRRKSGEIIYIHLSLSLIKNENKTPTGMIGYAIDITQRKRAEDALRESEERFREIAENINEVFWVRNPDKMVYISPAYEEIWGRTCESLLQNPNSFIEAIHPDDLERILKAFQAALSPAKAFNEEYRIVRPDGSIRWVWARSFPTKSKERPNHSVGIAQDITERKRAEDALRTSEEKYRTLTFNIPGMIYRGRPDWSTEIIQNSEVLCGYSIDEFNSRKVNWLDLIHPDNKDQVLDEVAKIIDAPDSIHQEYRIIAKDGKIRWVSDHKTSFFKEDGSLSGVDGIVYDITERKKVEEAVEHSEAQLHTLIAAASLSGQAIMMQQDRNGMEAVCVFANDAAVSLTGYTRNELSKKSWIELVHPLYRDAAADRYKRRMQGERISELFNIQIIRKNGTEVPVELASIMTTFKGKKTLVTLFRDITERKRAEDALRESEEKYRILFEGSKDAIYITTREGTVVESNPSLLDLFGYSREEMSDWSAKDTYLNPDDRSRFRKAMEESGSVKDFEVSLLKKDGTVMDCLITSAVRRSKEGDITGYQGIIRDVTELKRAQEERERLISKLQEALANVKTLSGLVPVCAYCKKVREDDGYWNQIEAYISKHSEAQFSHGICPACAEKHFPEWDLSEDSD